MFERPVRITYPCGCSVLIQDPSGTSWVDDDDPFELRPRLCSSHIKKLKAVKPMDAFTDVADDPREIT